MSEETQVTEIETPNRAKHVYLKEFTGEVRRRIIASRPGLVTVERVEHPYHRIVAAKLTQQHGDGDFVVVCTRVGGRREFEVLCGTPPSEIEGPLSSLKMIGDKMSDLEHETLNDGAQFALPGGLQVVNVAA